MIICDPQNLLCSNYQFTWGGGGGKELSKRKKCFKNKNTGLYCAVQTEILHFC